MQLPHSLAELGAYEQWVVWKYEPDDKGVPTKRLYQPKSPKFYASHSRASTWGSFAEACAAAPNFEGIGFVLTAEDPFCVIDLDAPKGNKGTQEYYDFQREICQKFQSYTEITPSGKGAHIWVRGGLAKGIHSRETGVEIYSHARFMTITGNVYLDLPISERQELIGSLAHYLESLRKKPKQSESIIASSPQRHEDSQVWEMASSASNGAKFRDLWAGNWTAHYGSQSDADFALINIIAFYTRNHEQIVRMFHLSALGQRDKAKRADYLRWMLERCHDTQTDYAQYVGLDEGNFATGGVDALELDACEGAPSDENKMLLPPGLVGEITQFIYANSTHPTEVLSVTGALAMMSGVCGRAYQVMSTGLNQYYLLVAKSGRGKESIPRGVSALLHAAENFQPGASNFFGPNTFASGQALHNYIAENNSFVSFQDEFGKIIPQIAKGFVPAHLGELYKLYLSLYSRSGKNERLSPIRYSDSKKILPTIQRPAFSLYGYSSPDTLFQNLTEAMITDGFIPRFLLMEYTGPRVPFNEGFENVYPHEDLARKVAALCGSALHLNNQNRPINIAFSRQAHNYQREFRAYADAQINDAQNDSFAEIWNRAHLKALKLAGMLAVGKSLHAPTIEQSDLQWAIWLVERDIRMMSAHFEAGEVGEALEQRQIGALRRFVRLWLCEPWEKLRGYKTASESARNAGLIPYRYLAQRCMQLSYYRQDRIGATAALKRAIQTLIETGELLRVNPEDAAKFNCRGAVYARSKFDG